MKIPPLAKTAALVFFAFCAPFGVTQAQTVLIDFGNSSSFRGASQVGADENGNYWTSVFSGAYYPSVVDVTGTNTSIGFGFSSAGGTDSFNGPAGATTNPITQQQLDNVQIDSSALGLLGGSDAAAIDYYTDSTLVLQGLNASLTYDLTFFGSHEFNVNNVTRYSTYTDNTFSNVVNSTTLNVGVGSAQNQSNVATLTSLPPQTNNTLYVGFAGDGGTGTGYLNAMSLYGYLGFLSGGTNTLNSGSTYVAIGNYTNGDSRSVDSVIGEGTTVQVNNASGIYYNSTLVVTNGGGIIGRGTNFTIYALTGAGNLALTGTNGLSISKGGNYSGTLTMANGTLTLNGNGALGTGGLVLNGGNIIVNAAQGLGTGTITVASGTTTLNNSSALTALTGNNNFVLSGDSATLQVWGNGQVLNLGTGNVSVTGFNNLNAFGGGMQFNGAISGSGTLNWYGGGSLVLGGSNTFSGTVNAAVNGGSLVLSNVNALQSATLNKGTNHNIVFGLAGSNTYNLGGLTGAGNITLSNGNSLNVNSSASSTYSGALSDSGSLTKSGSGTFTLSGANTHLGGTTLSAGQLNINSASALGTGTLRLGNGAKFDNTSGGALTNTQNNAISLGGTSSFLGSSSLNLGAGTVTLGGNSQLNVTGGLRLGGDISGSSTLTKVGNGTLTLAGTNFGSSQLVVAAGTLTLTDANRSGWTNSTGAIRLEGGTLSMINGNNLGAYPGSGGVQVQFAGNSTLRFDGTGTLNANRGFAISNGVTATIDVQGFTPSMNNVVQGGGSLNKIGAGALSLGGANTYSGGTTLSAGQLNINNASALGAGTFTMANGTTFNNTSAGAITNTQNNAIVLGSTNTFAGTQDLHLGNGSVTFSGNTRLNVNANNLTLGGNLSGSDAFNKDGVGTLTLAGSNSMTSFVVVDYGILKLANVDALANAQLYLYGSAPNKTVTFGAAGTNTYNLGALSGAAGGTLSLGANSVNIGGADLTTTYNGLIEGTGGLAKSGTGTLTLTAANTYSGETTVQSGSLKVSDATALGATNGFTTVESGATLEVSGGISVAENITINGEGVDSGGAIRGSGDGHQTLTGTITLAGDGRIRAASPTGSPLTLQSLGSSFFTVDTDYTTATYSQTGTSVQLTAAALGDMLSGLFTTTNNWSGVSDFGLRMSVDGTNPDLTYSVRFYDADFAEVAGFTGSTYGLGSEPGIALLTLAAAGPGSAASIVGMDFTWGGDDSIANSTFDIVAAPSSSLTIAGNVEVGSNVLLLGAQGTTNSGSVGGNITLSGMISGAGNTNALNTTITSLYKDGAGTVTLSGANDYTGDTRIAFGALTVASGGNLGSGSDVFIASGASLQVRTDTAVATVEENGIGDGGTLDLGSNTTLTVNGADKGTIYQSTITGQGNLTVAASGDTVLALYGDNSFSGNVTITGGTLAAAGAGSNQTLKSITSMTVGSGATLLLGASDQVRNAAFITLSGGTIQRAAGVSEVFGALELSTASFLDFGTGATGTLSFGSYAPSSLMTVNNFFQGNTLTFGSNLTSTIADTGLFSFSSGFTSSWNSGATTFTITAIPEPSTVIAALALIALLLWPSRRRLMLDTLSILGMRRPARERLIRSH